MKSFFKKTFKTATKFLCLLVFFSFSNAFAQNVSVSGAVAGNGSYPDLFSAFTAINGGLQTGANINVSILASTTETSSAVLNAGAWTSLSISPSGGSFTVSGNISGSLIDLNGADNVTINGLNSGGNALTISNTNTLNLTTNTIRFLADATFNTIINCTILGSSTSLSLGTITFSTALTLGNSNNLISSCNIGSAGTNLPANALFSAGTATAVNASNSVQNCNIFDFFSPNLASSGIFISTNSSNWIIGGNRLFQTAARTYTVANTIRAIQVTAGNSYTIANNVIGYSSSTGTGSTIMSSSLALRYIGIDLSVGTLTASSVQGNTVAAITETTNSGTSTGFGALCGININSGNVNITGNLIGATTGTGSVACYLTASGGLLAGINSSSTGTLSITNNYIGSCIATGTIATVAGSATGINISGVATGLSVISNTIGNGTTDNIMGGTAGLITAASIVHGINFPSTPSATNLVISGNLIQNMAAYGASTSGAIRGIRCPTSNFYSVTSNTIINLTSNNLNTSVGSGIIGTAGIQCDLGGSNYTVSNNLIMNIANTGTSTGAVVVVGIGSGASTGTNTFSYNRIYNLINTSPGVTATGPPIAAGFFIRSGSNVLIYHNNMVSLGNGQTSNTSFMGIYGNHGSTPNPTVQVYYNTFNIEGTVTSGSLSTFGIGRTDFSATARTPFYDLRNNLITNTRAGGSGGHYAVANNFGATASTIGWPANVSNNNILNANASTVGWWNAALTFPIWQTTSASDANSYSGATVNYVNSATDLHLNMGLTPNLMESSAQTIPGFSLDIDGQNRPGPSGSVNGGGSVPDIGADEIDGVVLDIAKPIIAYTPLTNTCVASDRTFTATITDFTGVPTTGAFIPAVYYRKNAGAYVSASGVLSSGSSTNGVWSFTISAAALGGISNGDLISYFVIAQDITSPIFNIGSNPAAGLVAVNVTSVTTAPILPNVYFVSSLAGTYSVGAAGNFTSMTAAANVYNNSCLTGPVTFVLTDALYSSLETFPITFSNNPTASATNSLLIRPAASISPVITGSSAIAIVKITGGDFITIDGSNNGTSTKDLTVENTSTLSTGVIFWLGNSSLTDAASNLSIRNTVITGSIGVNTLAGIIIGSGITLGNASDLANNAISISGNIFRRLQQAVFASGNATLPDANWSFTSNFCGSSVVAEKLGFRGILVQNAQNVTIVSNTVSGITNTVSFIIGAGILVGANATNYTVTNNVITDLKNTNLTTTSGFNGILLQSSSATANILVANNFVSDISTFGSTTAGTGNNGYGITINGGAGYRIYHNSILLNTNQTVSGVQAALFVTSGVSAIGAIDLRNNIFANTQTLSTERYAIHCTATNSVFSNIDFNNYSTLGPNLGFIGSSRSNLAALQLGFGGNLNSNTVAPVFTSSADLHLVPASNAALDGLGTGLSAFVPTDIDNQSRSTTTPDMGADEFTGPGCVSLNGGTLSVASYTGCSGSSFTLSSSGVSSGSGIALQWRVSSTPGGPYANVTAGTGFLNPSLNTGSLVASTYYYILTSTCTSASLTASTNEATVSVLQVPTASAAISTPSICPGQSITLSGSTNVGTVYNWTGPNSFTSSTQSPVLSAVTSSASGLYFFSTSLGICNSPTVAIRAVVLGSVNVITPASISSSAICNGASSTLSVAAAPSNTAINLYAFTSSGASALIPTASGNTVLTSGNDDTPMAAPAAIGFNFVFNGVSYSQFSASPDGWILLGGATAFSEFTNLITSTSNIPKIYPYWDDLATGTTGFVRTLVTGTAPNRILVVEWFVTIPRNTTGPANSSFQALLYESTNAIEFRYGVMGSGVMSASSGLTSSASVFNCVSFVNSSNSTTVANDNNSIQPANGTSYVFAPGNLSYNWSPNFNLSSTSLPTVTSTANASTIYTLTMSNNGSCSTTSTLSLKVSNSPSINVVSTSTLLCGGTSATITASGSDSYLWSNSVTSSSIVVNPGSTTSYSVVGTSTPCPGSASGSVNILAGPNPTVTISGSSGICTGQTATLLASGASSYLWNSGATTSVITDSPITNTTYTVTGTDALVGCTNTATQLVTVAASLSISILGPPNFCIGQTTNLTGNGGVTYTWNTGATTQTIAVSPTVTTTYSIIGASGTCSNSGTYILTVNSNPTISVTGNSVVCNGQSTTLTALGGNTYSWSTSALTATAVVSPSINSTYTVTGTNLAGCSATTVASVISNTLPIITIASSSGTVCALSPASFTASGATTYSWVSGPNNAVYTLTPAAAAIYTVNATNALLCSSSKTVSLATFSLPVLGINPSSATVCSLAQANFTATGASTYTWNNAISGATISLTPTLATTYSLTGTSAQGCISSATVGVVTNTLPILNISPPSATVCSFASVGFTASGASTYTWNNSSSFIGASFSSAPGNNITYTVVGTNTLGCSSSNTVAVATLSLPLVVITPSFATLCTLSTGIFTASGATSYSWSNATNASTVALSAVTTTVYSVSGTDVNGCVSGNQIVLLTNPLPTLAVTPNSVTVCPNVGQTFGASGATTYTWSTGTNSSSAVIVTAASSVYTVSGSDVNGCVGSATLAIITKTVPVIIVTPSSASVCLSASASFSASGANSYTWSNGSNFSGITVSPLVSTVYTVNAKGNSGCNGSTTVNLVVWQPPVINITASSLTVCARESITLTASGASTYTWFPFNLSGATLTNNPTFTLDYKVNATDINGCQNSDTITVFVDKCTGISKNNLSSEFVRIYPNPSTGFITASFGFEGSKEIKVLNSLGAFVMKIVTEDQSVAFDLSGYAKGVYFINVKTNGTYTNYKVIIQ